MRKFFFPRNLQNNPEKKNFLQAHTRIHRCPLKAVSHVHSWNCKSSNQSIPSTYICNGFPNCPNGEDEEIILCEGNPMWQIYLVICIGSKLALGLMSYLLGKFFHNKSEIRTRFSVYRYCFYHEQYAQGPPNHFSLLQISLTLALV